MPMAADDIATMIRDAIPDAQVEITDLGGDRFRIAVEDNGPGIVKQQIPKVFGKLLYGSKFHRLKQSRGQQGIGISAAVMYGQLTTGKAARVLSRTASNKPAHEFLIRIDTRKNAPDETDREIVRAANELSRVGVGARNLRVFRSSADREANLLEAVLGPSLRSRNPERRKEALESLESLAATVSHLKHLLLVRDLRRLTGE